MKSVARGIRVRPRAAFGFTLIEMLVAIALLAVVAMLSWRGLDATIRSRNDIVENLSQTRELGKYFAQLQYDALNVVAPEEVFGAPLRMRPNELVLVRHLGTGSGGLTQLQVVRYQLKGHELLRSASPPLSSLSQLNDALQHMDTFAGVVVSDQARAMGISVWLAPGGWTDRQAIISDEYARFLSTHGVSTVATRAMPLPRGIRLTVTTVAPVAEYVRTVPLGR
jgi:general secretion pathway protein J